MLLPVLWFLPLRDGRGQRAEAGSQEVVKRRWKRGRTGF